MPMGLKMQIRILTAWRGYMYEKESLLSGSNGDEVGPFPL